MLRQQVMRLNRLRWKETFTAVSRGSHSRDTNCCRLSMSEEAVRIGSAVRLGNAAWPPCAVINTSQELLLAKRGPGFVLTTPTGQEGSTWKPNIACAAPKAPSAIITSAPAPPSSAGWNRSLTVPCHTTTFFFSNNYVSILHLQ